LSYTQNGIAFWYFRDKNGKIDFRSASSQHRILLPDGSLFFLRAVRGEDDGTYYCIAFANNNNNNNNNNKAASVVKSQNATLRVACKFKKVIFPILNGFILQQQQQKQQQQQQRKCKQKINNSSKGPLLLTKEH
jgi:hypothetical protein